LSFEMLGRFAFEILGTSLAYSLINGEFLSWLPVLYLYFGYVFVSTCCAEKDIQGNKYGRDTLWRRNEIWSGNSQNMEGN
jgi:hypothetical protein